MSGPNIILQAATLAPSVFSADILHRCDLEIAAGEFTVIMGASGCGKTTLLRGLARFLPTRQGEIKWSNDTAGGAPPADGVGFVFQDARQGIFPWKTVSANLDYPRHLRQRLGNRTISLDDLGLRKASRRLPYTLSGGERKRLLLGMVLSYDPAALFLDEPLAGLDFDITVRMLAVLTAFHERTRSTIVMVTHSPLEAAFVASRVLCLHRKGLVELTGPKDTEPIITGCPFNRVRHPRTSILQEKILNRFTELVVRESDS